MDTFTRALQFTLSHEGGESNDSNDRGGHTKFGISQTSYPHIDITHLTIEQATEIYRKDFWHRCRCDDMPPLIARAAFDAAVNMGCTRSIKILQTAIGATPDGVIGPDTLRRIGTMGDDKSHARDMLTARARAYTSMADFPRYGVGWMARVIALAFDLHDEDV